MVLCKACRKSMPEDARFCGYCGFRITPLVISSSLPAPDDPTVASEADLAMADTLMGERIELNARQFPRFPMVVEISYSSEHNFFAGLSENISQGGLFIQTNTPAELGQLFEVAFMLPGLNRVMTTLCEVRWIRTSEDDLEREVTGIGLQFVSLDDVTTTAITAFSAHREPLRVSSRKG